MKSATSKIKAVCYVLTFKTNIALIRVVMKSLFTFTTCLWRTLGKIPVFVPLCLKFIAWESMLRILRIDFHIIFYIFSVKFFKVYLEWSCAGCVNSAGTWPYSTNISSVHLYFLCKYHLSWGLQFSSLRSKQPVHCLNNRILNKNLTPQCIFKN